MVFAMITRRLDETAYVNYFVRTDGRWFCLDTMIKGSSPLAPLDISTEGRKGPNPRLANGIAAKSSYLPLYGLVSNPLMFPKCLRGGRRVGKFHAAKYPSGLIAKGDFATVYLLTSFGRTGGPRAATDVGGRTSIALHLGRDLLEGRREVLTKTDCLPW